MADNVDQKTGTFTHDNMPVPQGDRVLPLFSLKGKTAIISGAGGGIGLAAAHGLAEAGANVAIWYNSNKAAITKAEEIEKTYGVKCRSGDGGQRGATGSAAFVAPAIALTRF